MEFKMDPKKVDFLLQYALAVAAEEDAIGDRYLGPIHLIKYVYLADLAYAESEGVTYTKAAWKFHNFGPWSAGVYERIEPALNLIGSEKKIFPSPYQEDAIRWTLKNGHHVINELNLKIELLLRQILKKYVHKFSSHTEPLLSHVYLTKPMLMAAPGEELSFHKEESYRENIIKKVDIDTNSKKKLKKIKEIKTRIQLKLKTQIADKKKNAEFLETFSPRYDDVFFEGREWLDSLAGDPIVQTKGQVEFSPDVWKSQSRFHDDVS